MASYGALTLTTKGQALYTKAQSGTTLTFTRMQIGSGSLGSTDPTTLNNCITPIAYFLLSGITTTGPTAFIKGTYNNSAITVSTYSCELALYAQDPVLGEILYAYANAGAQGDTIPPISSGPFSRQYQINCTIGAASSVTASIPATVYVATSSLGVASGVATLDTNTLVPIAQLPTGIGANQLGKRDANGNIPNTGLQPISISANTALTPAQSGLIDVTTGSSVITLTLPSAATAQLSYIVKKADSGSGSISIAASSSQLIDGVSSKTILFRYDYIQFVSDGTGWQIVDGNVIVTQTAGDNSTKPATTAYVAAAITAIPAIPSLILNPLTYA